MIAASPCHAPVLAAIHAACFAPEARWGPAAIATLLAQPGSFALLDAEGGFVLARTAADEAEILTLAVLPERRRQGRGRALLRAAMGEAARRGAGALFLEVAEANAAAIGLYRGLGFQPVGRRVGYYPGGGHAAVLRRALDAAMVAEQAAAP